MLVIAGETIVDMIASPEAPMHFAAHLGGGPYNVAKAAAKMNQETGYLSPLSTDQFGNAFAKEMQELGVKALADRSHDPSGIAIIQTNSKGVPSYIFHRAHAADRDVSLETAKAHFPASAQMFYIGGLALVDGQDAQIWQEFCDAITTPIYCDPNIRPSFIRDEESYRARLGRILENCNILKLSDEDIAWLEPHSDPEEYIQKIQNEFGIDIAFLTLGAHGAKLYFEGKTAFADAPIIEVKDTVGAGDCFSAAALARILQTGGLEAQNMDSLKSTLRFAVTAAAMNCTRAGANAPTTAEVEAFMARQ